MFEFHTEKAQIDESTILDTNIPINIKLQDWDDAKSCYFRRSEQGESSLELELSSKSGKIRSIQINAISEINILQEEYKLYIEEYETGIPKIVEETWSMTYDYELIGSIKVDLYKNLMKIELLRYFKIKKYAKFGRLIFAIDEFGNLCMIVINELTEKERQEIINTLNKYIERDRPPYLVKPYKATLFKNQIHYKNAKQMQEIKAELETKESMNIMEIQGETIQTQEEYVKEILRVFRVPINSKGFESTVQWLTHLSWFHREDITLIINNYSEFMKNDEELKEKVVESFRDYILPWWITGAKKYLIPYEEKSFNLYLVD